MLKKQIEQWIAVHCSIIYAGKLKNYLSLK